MFTTHIIIVSDQFDTQRSYSIKVESECKDEDFLVPTSPDDPAPLQLATFEEARAYALELRDRQYPGQEVLADCFIG